MTRAEAQEILQEIKHYLTAGNPVWRKEVVAEALDIAIEALTQDSTQDLISRSRAIDACLIGWNKGYEEILADIKAIPSADEQDDNRLYIRIYANDEPSRKAEKLYQICGETESQEVAQWLKEYFPSVDRQTTDCTEFMEWLKAEVLDENNWELNAVAYGEIICRKLKKLGWIDVEDGCYVDTRPTGEWIEMEVIPEVYDIEGVKTWGSKMQCDQCGFRFMAVEGHIRQYNYCPNCGARMLGEDGEA